MYDSCSASTLLRVVTSGYGACSASTTLFVETSGYSGCSASCFMDVCVLYGPATATDYLVVKKKGGGS